MAARPSPSNTARTDSARRKQRLGPPRRCEHDLTRLAIPALHPPIALGTRYRLAQPFTGLPLPPIPAVLRRLVAPPARQPTVVPVEVVDADRYGQAALTGEIQRIRAAPRPTYTGGQRSTRGGRNDA